MLTFNLSEEYQASVMFPTCEICVTREVRTFFARLGYLLMELLVVHRFVGVALDELA
jgi:hypothetical protein